MTALRVFGWIIVPYIMIFIQWSQVRGWKKFGVFFLDWAVLAIEFGIISRVTMNINFGVVAMLYGPAQLVLFIIAGMVSFNKKERSKQLAKGIEKNIRVFHVDGLNLGESACDLDLYADKLQIKNIETNQILEIYTDQIFKADVENIRKETNFSLGKAAIGEVVAGPVGAVIAGASGGSKATLKNLLTIGFVTKENENKEISFVDTSGVWSVGFARAVRSKIKGITTETEPTIHQL